MNQKDQGGHRVIATGVLVDLFSSETYKSHPYGVHSKTLGVHCVTHRSKVTPRQF